MMRKLVIATGVIAALVAIACAGDKTGGAGASTATASGDSSFKALAARNKPTSTSGIRRPRPQLGIHTSDDKIDDYSAAAFESEAAADSTFRARLAAVETSKLSVQEQLDRQQLVHAMDATILGNRVIKNWAKNPDTYSSGITNAAYVVMERTACRRRWIA